MSATTGPTSLGSNLDSGNRGAWLRGIPFAPKRNSLNLIRLALAFLVLVSHSYPIMGRGNDPRWANESLGGWAVIGFFVLSGYLIMGSRVRTDAATYFMHRVGRIFPAFIACLVVTALLFAPIAYWYEHNSLSGFLTTPNTPANLDLSPGGVGEFVGVGSGFWW